jgi:hypothetical protein
MWEDDVWASVLPHLGDEPATLCACAEVCALFRTLCASDDSLSEEIWKRACSRSWQGKKNKQLVVGKRALARYRQFCPSERPDAAADGAAATTRACPRGPSVWKLSFFEAEWESKRTTLSIDEVCGHLWAFHFLHHRYHPSPRFIVRYNADFTYESCMFTAPLPWRLVGASSLQVDAYPVLQASRDATWGWNLENMYVRMEQLDVPSNQYEEWWNHGLQSILDATEQEDEGGGALPYAYTTLYEYDSSDDASDDGSYVPEEDDVLEGTEPSRTHSHFNVGGEGSENESGGGGEGGGQRLFVF